MDDKTLLISSRAFEKSSKAIMDLAAGRGGLTPRLTAACLELSILHGRQLPERFEEDFKSIHDRMTSRSAEFPGEGSIHASIRNMHYTVARQLARDIVAFTLNVHSAVGM